MKKYLKNDTKLNITRSVKNPYSAQNFTTIYGQAVKDNDLTTSSGTVSVSVDLHPDEYKNFVGCNPNIVWVGKRPYLDEDPLYYIDNQGRVIDDSNLDSVVVFDPNSAT